MPNKIYFESLLGNIPKLKIFIYIYRGVFHVQYRYRFGYMASLINPSHSCVSMFMAMGALEKRKNM
uniref:Uncharacterized protein n=1 Tax=Rhizophora mucronata TaxID=61149 RepID=A0A2P2NVG5_RHIMU